MAKRKAKSSQKVRSKIPKTTKGTRTGSERPEKAIPADRANPRGKRGWIRGCFKLILICLLLGMIVPPLQVLVYAKWNPRWIPLMSVRKLEAHIERHPAPPVRYRWVPMEHMPVYLVRCVVVAEDARFLNHDGFDWIEVKAAMARSGRGASTITMQCARTLFLWQGRSYIRKGLEAYYTFWMEKLMTKRRILELYLNVVETGKGVYGFPAAATYYFGKAPSELSRSQLAYCAALLPAPTKWDPRQPSPKLKWRRALIERREKDLRFPATDVVSGKRVD